MPGPKTLKDTPAAVAKRRQREDDRKRSTAPDALWNVLEGHLLETILALIVSWRMARPSDRESRFKRDQLAASTLKTLRATAKTFLDKSLKHQWDAITVSLLRELTAIYSDTRAGKLAESDQYGRIVEMLHNVGITVNPLDTHLVTLPPRSIRLKDALALRRSSRQIKMAESARKAAVSGQQSTQKTRTDAGGAQIAAATALEKLAGISGSQLKKNLSAQWPDIRSVEEPLDFFGTTVTRLDIRDYLDKVLFADLPTRGTGNSTHANVERNLPLLYIEPSRRRTKPPALKPMPVSDRDPFVVADRLLATQAEERKRHYDSAIKQHDRLLAEGEVGAAAASLPFKPL